MYHLIAIPVGVGLVYWWSTSKRTKGSQKTKKNANTTAELPPETHGPLDGPGGEEPAPDPEPEPKPEPKPLPIPTVDTFPGPYLPHDPFGELGPVPIPIYEDTTSQMLEDWPNHDFHVFIRADCSAIFVGSKWVDEVFLPSAVDLVSNSPDRYHSVAAIVWEIIVQPFDKKVRVNPATECLKEIPDFRFRERTPRGSFTQYYTVRYDEYSAAWDKYKQKFPDLSEFYTDLTEALENHPQIRSVLEQEWDD